MKKDAESHAAEEMAVFGQELFLADRQIAAPLTEFILIPVGHFFDCICSTIAFTPFLKDTTNVH